MRGLVKHYGETKALDGVDLDVREGTVMGVLGPNGAGKTTLVRILSTLLTPDAGRATVAGYDVLTQPRQLRRVIGLTGQYASVDEKLPGWENLYMIGRLLDLPRKDARRRADELLERFSLTDAAKRPGVDVLRRYAAPARPRRLDDRPPVRPLPRRADHRTRPAHPQRGVERGQADGRRTASTVLLTTQYMEEAEQLASELTVIDRGKVIASGRHRGAEGPGRRPHAADPARRPAAAATAGRPASTSSASPGSPPPPWTPRRGTVLVPILSDEQLTAVVGAVSARGITLTSITTELPSLDEVFLSLTGHRASAPQDAAPARDPRGGRRMSTAAAEPPSAGNRRTHPAARRTCGTPARSSAATCCGSDRTRSRCSTPS